MGLLDPPSLPRVGAPGTFRVVDSTGLDAFSVEADGTTRIRYGQIDNFVPSEVHIFIGAGQSNMSGRGKPFGSELDPIDGRIYQFGATASQISQAQVPLPMVDQPSGISPLTIIAREHLARTRPGVAVLLIPAARGDSAVVGPTETGANGVWNAVYTGASVNLYALMLTQITAARAAAAVRWPKSKIVVKALFWHQGEGNSGTDATLYAQRIDAIFAGVRTHVADAALPVVLGGMVPEYVAANSAGLTPIRAVHVATPSRLTRAGYGEGPKGGGGSTATTDTVHYHREGVERLGKSMLDAFHRALTNTSTSIPHAPNQVSAQRAGAVLTVNWSQPACRYTGFLVEYSDNGGAWTTIAGTTADNTASVSGVTGPVQVRVSTINESGTSTPAATITAQGA